MRALLLTLILCLPAAASSGTFQEGPVTIVVENGHNANCLEETTGLCLASASGDGPGTLELDVNQQVRFVGVAADAAYVNDLLMYDLLPDRTLTFDASKLETEHGVFRLLVERVGNRSAPAPLDDFGIILAPQGFAVRWYGPNAFRPSTEFGRNGVYFLDIQEPGEGGFEYERVSGYHQVGDTDTDARFEEVVKVPCWVAAATSCVDGHEAIIEQYRSASPNVTVGLAFHEAAAGDSPAALARSEPLAPRGTAAPLASRASPPAPSSTPLAFPAAARGLPEAGGQESGARATPTERTLTQDPRPSPPPLARPLAHAPPDAPALALVATVGATLAVVAAALYSRITRDGALQSGRRMQLLAALEAEGPQGVRDLGRALGVDHTTVEHHVRVLHRLSHVTILRDGNHVLVGLPGQECPAKSAPPNTAQAVLVETLRQNGGSLARRALARLVADIPARTRNHALLRLIQEGVIRREWDGAREVVRLTP